MKKNCSPLNMQGIEKPYNDRAIASGYRISGKDRLDPDVVKGDSTIDEKALICAARQGDLQAFNGLVLAYQDKAYTQAYYLLSNPTAAENAVEKSFITAYQTISMARDGTFQDWLSHIVTDKCLDELRRNKKHPTSSSESCHSLNKESESSLSPVDPRISPEKRLIQAKDERFLLRCLDRLNLEQRITLVLIDIMNMSYGEAAKMIGCPPGRIKSQLAQARLQMQHFLQDNRACYKPVT